MLSDDDRQRALMIGYQLALSYSKKHNVLFEFVAGRRVGWGGTRRFDDSSVKDRDLVGCSSSSKVSSGGFVVWNDSDNRVKPDYVVSVGIKELSSGRRTVLSYGCAVASLVIGMAHEMRHVHQYDVARGQIAKPEDMPAEALWSLVATCGNRDFRDANYRCLPHEVDAERHGVVGSIGLLQGILGESEFERAISQSLRRSSRLNIGPVQYSSVPRFFSQKWFSAKVDSRVAAGDVRDVRCLFKDFSPDFAARYFSLNEQDCETFKSLEQGYEQDVYLAKVNVKFNEKEREFFDRLSLSFPMGAPEPCGGVVSRVVAAQVQEPPVDVSMIGVGRVADDVATVSEEMGV